MQASSSKQGAQWQKLSHVEDSVRTSYENKNGNGLFWAVICGPSFKTLQSNDNDKLSDRVLNSVSGTSLSFQGPSVPMKAILAHMTWDSGHSGPTALQAYVSTWSTSTFYHLLNAKPSIERFTYIICKLEEITTTTTIDEEPRSKALITLLPVTKLSNSLSFIGLHSYAVSVRNCSPL